MMARYRIHAAGAFLIRAFAPECPTNLRSWSAKLEKRGERVIITFDLPTAAARKNAAELARRAPTMRLIAIGGKSIREIHAEVERELLTVNALLVKG